MAKNRKVSSISREFDGKEVQGKLIKRSGLFGSKVSKEVFKMPGGGKHIEKTRTNKKGDVVSRLSRDTKVNPLKVFNDNKEKAYKKAGGEMSKYKKALRKAQPGTEMGPMTQEQAANAAFASAANDPMSYGNGPRLLSRAQAINKAKMEAVTNRNNPYGGIDPLNNMRKLSEGSAERERLKLMNGDMIEPSRFQINPSTGRMTDTGRAKKGGSVKRKRK